jgi:hypothetical protein
MNTNGIDWEYIVTRIFIALAHIAVLTMLALLAGYIVGSIQIREPSTQEKVTKYLQQHYGKYIDRKY